MLRASFLHLPGVGRKRERSLWRRGVLSWEDLRAFVAGGFWQPASGAPAIAEEIERGEAALESGDASHFAARLPARERCRLARDFDGRIAFLDIETDSAPYESLSVTVAGLYDGARARVFVKDCDLDKLPDALSAFPVVCTFNGASFDMPILARSFGKGFYRGAHIDLRPVCASLGMRGGLKRIEESVGIRRPDAIRGMNGYDAVRLWIRHSRGDDKALGLLARYNLADTVVLLELLRVAYNRRISEEDLPFLRFDRCDDPNAPAAVEEAVRPLARK